jgi:glyoxylase-like metal-dependent hydrolase (beta-lactamase superfamily II)
MACCKERPDLDNPRFVQVNQKHHNHSVRLFESSQGARIVRLPLNAFPDFWVYAYLVLYEEYCLLIDTGSGFHNSDQHLEEGFQAASEVLDQAVNFADLSHILITHGHIDHFGGLPFLRSRTKAHIGVHELDRLNLTHTEERLTLIARRLDRYLLEAGISVGKTKELVDIYRMTKLSYQPGPVDFTYEDIGMCLGPFEMLHVPGHCAGQVVIRLHDVLFCGDHILSNTTPHQAPELLSLHTGLSHYLQSLVTCQTWSEGVQLALGGHNEPIHDISSRILKIQQMHHQRLDEFLVLLAEPLTIADISRRYFGTVHGYNILLALEEAGAHVEYLYQRGLLEIANLDELGSVCDPVPIRYRKN